MTLIIRPHNVENRYVVYRAKRPLRDGQLVCLADIYLKTRGPYPWHMRMMICYRWWLRKLKLWLTSRARHR